jgi:hypothetical protein
MTRGVGLLNEVTSGGGFGGRGAGGGGGGGGGHGGCEQFDMQFRGMTRTSKSTARSNTIILATRVHPI